MHVYQTYVHYFNVTEWSYLTAKITALDKESLLETINSVLVDHVCDRNDIGRIKAIAIGMITEEVLLFPLVDHISN